MAKKPELRDVYRDVKTGKYVSAEEHGRRPTVTEHERRPVPAPLPEHKRHPLRKGK
jgi:hypothetical protein